MSWSAATSQRPGSDLYANWQRQLLSFADCQPYLPGYCRRGWPARRPQVSFVAGLKAAMKDLAIRADAGYPDNADLVIEEDGRPSLKARTGAERTASARALEAEVKERLPERSLLKVLARGTRWVGWPRHLGPLSGSDPKLADPLERYMLVALTYGCNLGPHQAARPVRAGECARSSAPPFRRHVTVDSVEQGDRRCGRCLPWRAGPGPRSGAMPPRTAVDGTKYEIYVGQSGRGVAHPLRRLRGIASASRRQLHRVVLAFLPVRGVGGRLSG